MEEGLGQSLGLGRHSGPYIHPLLSQSASLQARWLVQVREQSGELAPSDGTEA